MKKSILFVNGHLKVGGVEKALVDLLSWIDYGRYDVDLLLLEGEGEYLKLLPEQVRVLHKDIRQLEGPFWKNLWKNLTHARFGNIFYRIVQVIAAGTDKRLLRLTRPMLPVRKHYDAAVAFRPGHYAEIAAFTVQADMRVCWWHHGSVPGSQSKRKELSSLLHAFDKVVTVSEGCKDLLVSAFGIKPEMVVVIPNIIDTDKIDSAAGGDDPFGEDNRYRIVTLSRFAPEKHLEEAVEAASLLEGKLDFVWYMIGDGAKFEMVKDRVAKFGLCDRVILTGSVANPYPYLKHADLMVHPSHVESLCISVLEAMALGLPCVVVRSFGPESFIRNGHNGVLVEKGAQALAEGVETILGMHPSSVGQMTANGRVTVGKSFCPETVINEFYNLIDGGE